MPTTSEYRRKVVINAIKKKKIILVGGAGFIGHNLAISLQMKGADVKVLDSLQVNNLGEHSNSKNRKRKPNIY